MTLKIFNVEKAIVNVFSLQIIIFVITCGYVTVFDFCLLNFKSILSKTKKHLYDKSFLQFINIIQNNINEQLNARLNIVFMDK